METKIVKLTLENTTDKQPIFMAGGSDKLLHQLRITNNTASAASIQMSYGTYNADAYGQQIRRAGNTKSNRYKKQPAVTTKYTDTVLTGDVTIPANVSVDILPLSFNLSTGLHIFAKTSSYASFEVVLFYEETKEEDDTPYVPQSQKGWKGL